MTLKWRFSLFHSLAEGVLVVVVVVVIVVVVIVIRLLLLSYGSRKNHCQTGVNSKENFPRNLPRNSLARR